MDVLIRTDASDKIGSGHVMRCLTIANELQKRNINVIFFMQPHPGNLINEVKKRGFPVVTTFTSTDVCIIDHYDIDIAWENKIRPHVKKIFVIDDLANRKHDCDLLLDQNFVENYTTRYDDLVPHSCKKLLGLDYLLIRDEFHQERKILRKRTSKIKRLLVFMGGADPTGETLKVLRALQNSKHNFSFVDVVVGNSNSQAEKIAKICAQEGYLFHKQIDYMARLMHEADFAFGTGGSALWERCMLGLPSASTIVATNQIEATEHAANQNVTWNLGWYDLVSVETYQSILNQLSSKQAELTKMSETALLLTQNVRSARDIVDILLEELT